MNINVCNKYTIILNGIADYVVIVVDKHDKCGYRLHRVIISVFIDLRNIGNTFSYIIVCTVIEQLLKGLPLS